jgi:hypothetical protein
MAMIIIRMVLFSLRAARSRVAADKKPTEKNNGDDKNGHREKNTQSHDVTPEAKNMTCPATKPLSRRIEQLTGKPRYHTGYRRRF